MLLAAILQGGCREPLPAAEIEAAALAYVREVGSSAGAVRAEAASGDYARARVAPVNGGADTVWIFLRREAGVWRGLAYGTSLRPEDYQELGIPWLLRVR